MSTFEEDEYGILKSGSAYYLPGRDIPYSTQKAALAAENERLTTRVNALEAALEATTTAMLEWEEDLSPTNQRAKLALIAEARSALTRDTGALDTPSPRLPGGTRVRLADTGQTGHLAPYSPGDGDRYTVILDKKDASGTRLAPMIRREQFEVIRPAPNELTNTIVSIALAGVESRQRQEPKPAAVDEWNEYNPDPIPPPPALPPSFYHTGYDDGEPFAGADDPAYQAARMRGRLE